MVPQVATTARAQIFKRVILDDGMKALAENEPGSSKQSKKERDQFEDLFTRPSEPWIFEPEEHKWRHDDDADAVAQPPSEPNRRVARRLGQASQNKSCAADGSADCSADHTGEKDEFENILRVFKSFSACGKTSDKVRADEGFKRIASGDTERSEDSSGGCEIDQEGSSEDSGPDAVAKQQ
jgi:hypothetical protein